MRPNTVALDEHGVQDTVSIDPVSDASLPQANIHHNKKPQMVRLIDAPGAKPARPTSPLPPTEAYEYAVDEIVRHFGQSRSIKYIVRWYG